MPTTNGKPMNIKNLPRRVGPREAAGLVGVACPDGCCCDAEDADSVGSCTEGILVYRPRS